MTDSFSQIFFNKLWEHLKPGGRDLGETIRSSIDFGPVWNIRIGDVTIPVTGAMISLVTSVLILIVLALWLRRGLRKHGISGKQALTEKLYLIVINLCESFGMNRQQAEIVLPWTLTLGLYIFLNNHRRHAIPRARHESSRAVVVRAVCRSAGRRDGNQTSQVEGFLVFTDQPNPDYCLEHNPTI